MVIDNGDVLLHTQVPSACKSGCVMSHNPDCKACNDIKGLWPGSPFGAGCDIEHDTLVLHRLGSDCALGM